jgi:hypothetical protein
MDFQPTSIIFEPIPNRRILVVRGIVLNQMGSLRVIASGQLLQKNQVGRCIEYVRPMIGKLCGEDLNRAKDLDAFPLPSNRNLRLTPNGCPSLIQRGILAETGFVFKDQRGPFTGGFFLDSDMCSGAICLALPDLPAPTFVSAVAPKIRSRAAVSVHALDDNGSQTPRQSRG